MTDVSKLVESKNLNGEELGRNLRTATISAAHIEEFDEGDKVVVSMLEFDKTLICNKTQLKTLVDFFGTETSNWVDKKISLVGEKLQSGRFSGRWTIKIFSAQKQPEPEQTVKEVPF